MKSIVVAVPQSKNTHKYKRYSPFRSNLKCYFQRYGMLTLFIVILFSGMIFGAIKAGMASTEILNKIDTMFSRFLNLRSNQTPAVTFMNSFTISFVFMAVLYFSSLSPLGIFFIPTVMFFRGFEYGLSSGFLCVTYGIKGLAYYITVILSGAFISSLALIYSSQYCIDFSVSLLFSVFEKGTSDGMGLKSKLGEMTLNCAYMIILIIFSSLLDTGLYYLIGGLFSF